MNHVRVLIADDEQARCTLRKHLSGLGWIKEIHEWDDGLGAMRALDELRPDLMFMDIRMPADSGIAVSERISHRLHIIFTTELDGPDVPAFEIGALDYLPKPFERERVERVVSRARSAIACGGMPAIAARVWNALSDAKMQRMKLVS